MTGAGGWPMTCFLTPDGAPFFCGTYFPRPQFHRLLAAVERGLAGPPGGGRPAPGSGSSSALARAARASRRRRWTPRCWTSAAAALRRGLRRGARRLRRARRSSRRRWCWSSCCAGTPAPGTGLDMVVGTAEAMARGGMYDQLAGGFARYSVDAGWVVPHFEKMLYDNALLLRVYLHLWRATGSPLARRVAAETADFLLRDLRTPEGGFASALDADTDGRRGPDVRVDAGPAAGRARRRRTARWAGATCCAVGEAGTFEHGSSTLQLRADPDDPHALGRGAGAAARRPRPAGRSRPATTRWSPPGTGWRSPRWPTPARCSGEPAWVDAAATAADLLLAAAPGRRPAAAHLPRRGGGRAGRRAGGLRRPGRGAARAAPGHRVAALAGPPPASCSTWCWPGSATAAAASTTPPTTPRR